MIRLSREMGLSYESNEKDINALVWQNANLLNFKTLVPIINNKLQTFNLLKPNDIYIYIVPQR
jgi:hypothetical protein